MSATFTYQEFHELLDGFAAKLPPLLAKSPTTADLARQVDSLMETADSPFTVAVMGQMRSGKSTLLNALIGRDLAVTGVNETTATINWFKHAESAADCDRFRVRWKDAPEETFPLARIEEWIGDSAPAQRTQCLEFFAQSEFLKTANIVDTPGTRSVIHGHTNKLAEFLHDASRRQGGKADAILYVLMPVARENDADWLDEFEKNNRLPGSHPYNSIAVIHKWEMMIDAADPYAEVLKKAARIHDKMKDKVSCVIPVSAPLAICTDRMRNDSGFWSTLHRLGHESTTDAIEMLTMQEAFYLDDLEGCSLSPADREALRAMLSARYPGLPWPSFKLMIRTAHAKEIATPDALRERVAEMSGIAKLNEELKTRYFARSKMIKAFSVLAKAWTPCQTAQVRLHNRKAALDGLIHNANAAESVLARKTAAGDASLQVALDYIKASVSSIDQEFRLTGETLREIAVAVTPIEDAFHDMDEELKAVEVLEGAQVTFDKETQRLLRHILGYHGPEIVSRVAACAANPAQPSMAEVLETIERLRRLSHSSQGKDAKQVLEIAITRLEQIADHIEATEA